ncbi:hypothetical protein U8527_13755 [Kordia algicida OT-1]|uniref:Uncharacterized protein n=1 Tax=Kordia algicida OT-1 TaxID=391587 RepID=A9DX69_9FLAO|nr:hypothetical protein [Kordia algicida]EDP95967.1 hypothetical protein KAOT1_07358 [Kordia algicida OT-1]
MKTIEKKDPYLNILNTEGNIYEEFLPDQVLTHKNLNKVVNYFEDQDRVSRVYLIGVGIGCGMNIVSYSEDEIIIGQGVGITTDGDIIKTETRRFQYYSNLTDRAAYALFEGTQVYEIYEQEGAGRPLDEHPLSSFTTNVQGTLKDYIVLAYVENYTEDEGLCGGSGCDETGNKVYSNIKFLLTHKSNYAKLIAGDTIYRSHDVLAYYDSLPELCVPRLLLNSGNVNSGLSIHNQFKETFYLKEELKTAIKTIIERFNHRINFLHYGVNINEITNYIDTIFTVGQQNYIQYKYDLLKDLVDTYREIRELILHTKFECVANIKAFPKHLLLGTLDENLRMHRRHSFYPSPTVSQNDKNLLAIRALCIRFYNQLKEYKIPNPKTATIKATPSKSYEYKLSERSIPYYYQTRNALVSNWNPVSIQQRKPKNQLGYHVLKLKNIPCVQEPLKFSHLDKDFYRIEGHLGKDYRTALKRIRTLKKQYNLAFDVKAVSIGFPVKKVSIEDDKCDTKDYSILLNTWEQEFCCTAESAIEFFENYQYKNLGDNGTSTTKFPLLTAQLSGQTFELFNKSATTGKINLEKTSEKTINVNSSTQNPKNDSQAQYQNSISYAIDQAYSYAGTQNVSAVYLSNIALQIIDQLSNGDDVVPDDYFFYTESAVKIIASLREIKRLFIKSLDEIYNTEKWKALNDAIELLCSNVDQVLFKISKAGENSSFGSNTHDKMYEYYIYDLSKLCCLKERFSWLKTQIDDIRYSIYNKLILSHLIAKHPGLEHMGGVPKGGTFLMVYIGSVEEDLDGTTVLKPYNGEVLYDFALPYMCCSDCPPETIVYSEEPETTLAISKTKFCLPADEGQVDFIISPSDGVVTSLEGEGFIVETENGYAFDPTLVPDNLIGTTLTFLVDGKTPKTPVEICVFKFPTDITANYNSPEWSDAGISVNLSVTHESVPYAYNYTYMWKRANGSEIGTGTDLSAISFENVGTTFEETLIVTIGIENEPGVCEIDVEVPVNESRPVPEDIEVINTICYRLTETSPTWVPITVMPFGAFLTSPQEPSDGPSFIEITDEGNYFINPAKVPPTLAGEDIKFRVNGTLIENKSTVVAMLPAFVNRDEEGNALLPYEIVEWTSESVIINLLVRHQFESETYIEYRWIDLNNNNSEIGDSRIVENIEIPADGDMAGGMYRVEMRVSGLEDSCFVFFDIDISLNRPTLDIPRGICFPESIELSVGLDDNVTTSAATNLIQRISSVVTFESGNITNAEIGQPIQVFLNDSLVATTTIYKVPSQENVRANEEFVRWDGESVIVDLTANPRVPGVANPQNYLEIKWFDDQGNPIADEDLLGFRVPAPNGEVNVTFKVLVCVKPGLGLIHACEVEVPITINYTRPTFELERGYCFDDLNPIPEITIPVSPEDAEITSPFGSDLITPSNDGNSYVFNPSQIGDGRIGELLTFEIGGVEITSTTVYRIPNENEIFAEDVLLRWEDNDVVLNLTTTLNMPSVHNPEAYLDIKWFDNNGNLIENTAEHTIATNGSVITTYTVKVCVKPELMDTDPCETDSIPVEIRHSAPTPDTPENLGLIDKYCWKNGTTPLSVIITVDPNDFDITSPQEESPEQFLIRENGNYRFVPAQIPDSEIGNPIEFMIDDQIVDTTCVFKMPADESLVHDTNNSAVNNGQYLFRFIHDYGQRDYMNYRLVDIISGQTLTPVLPNPLTYRVQAEGGARSIRYNLQIRVDNLECVSSKTVTVTVPSNDGPTIPTDPIDPTGPTGPTNPGTGTTNPLGRLVCSTPYEERLNILRVPDDIVALKGLFENRGISDTVVEDILNPLQATYEKIKRSKNLNNDRISEINNLNRLRLDLDEKYITDIRFANSKDVFLKLDEVLELSSLELLRCVDNDNAASLMTGIISLSNLRNADYGDNSRSRINDDYLNTFDNKGDNIKNNLNNTYSITKGI